MIRPAKIPKYQTVADAVEERYVLNIGDPLDQNLMREAQASLKASIFEFVGVEKIMKKQRWETVRIWCSACVTHACNCYILQPPRGSHRHLAGQFDGRQRRIPETLLQPGLAQFNGHPDLELAHSGRHSETTAQPCLA